MSKVRMILIERWQEWKETQRGVKKTQMTTAQWWIQSGKKETKIKVSKESERFKWKILS